MGLLDIFKKKEVKLTIDGNENAYCFGLIAMSAIDGDFDLKELAIVNNRIESRDWISEKEVMTYTKAYAQIKPKFPTNEALIIACVNSLDSKYYDEFYFDMLAVALSDQKLEKAETKMMDELRTILNVSDSYANYSLVTLCEKFDIR